MDSQGPFFTIFTPSYNRAHTLERLFDSLRRQPCRDFEWVIVDDGSTDHTSDLVRSFQAQESTFAIRYIWQENQHKKVAFNRGVREARGHLFIVIDSDDELAQGALEIIRQYWQEVPAADRRDLVGICGLCVDGQGRLVGKKFPQSPLDISTIDLYFSSQGEGEKVSALRVDVLLRYPFPEHIPGLVPESVVWFRIGKYYKQRCINEILRIYHNDVESLTRPDSASLARKSRIEGSLLFYQEALGEVTLNRLARYPGKASLLALQYVRWKCHYLRQIRAKVGVKGALQKLLVVALFPAGLAVYCLQSIRSRGASKRTR